MSLLRALILFMVAALTLSATTAALANHPQGPPNLVTICHKPGTVDEKTLTVPHNAWGKGHSRHGDTLGACEPLAPPRIFFSSIRDGNGEIYVMDEDGNNPTNLTINTASDFRPVVSPDGTKIAFHSNRDGNDEIYVMDIDGSNQTQLTIQAGSDVNPSWSPDSARIAFNSDRAGNVEIWVMDADGSNPTRLTNNPAVDTEASWSPDGIQIAFWSNRDAGNINIYVMDDDGSNVTRLTNNPATDFAPSWSPDGTLISFFSGRAQRRVLGRIFYRASHPTSDSSSLLRLKRDRHLVG